MITLIEALSFRSLHYIRQRLAPFQVLVGPNASGKSTFLDVLSFLGLFVSDGLEAAVYERSLNFRDLVWGRKGSRFELAIEASIPEQHQPPWNSADYDLIRYELAVGIGEQTSELGILDEQLLLGRSIIADPTDGVTGDILPPSLAKTSNPRWSPLIHRFRDSEINLFPEQHVDSRGEVVSDDYSIIARRTPKRAIFGQLPEDHFPASTWLADWLSGDIHHVELDGRKLRSPSPPGKGEFLSDDGSNLPWIVARLAERSPRAFADWLAHLRTALSELLGIRVIERQEDRHCYLMFEYSGGLEVPSWTLSDGTLRLVALTILAYVPDFNGVCLIEEPENSIHPLNIESVMQSLKSIYGGQMLVATQSPAILALTEPSDILVFSRDEKHGTTIVSGSSHPGLREWRGEVNLGTLFAGGILG